MKIILIILIISTSFLKAEEPFWEYIGGPDGGNCQDFAYNEEENIQYLTTTNGIYKSTDEGLSWDRFYYNKETKKSVINKNGNFLEILNSNEVFFFNSLTKERKQIIGLRLRNAFSQWLYMNIDSNDNCFIVSQTDQTDDTVELYLINQSIGRIDSARIIRSELDSIKEIEYFINETKFEDSIITMVILATNYKSGNEFSIIQNYDFHLNLISKIHAPRVWNIEYINKNIIGTIVHKGETYLSTDNGVSWELIFNKTGTFSKYKNDIYFFSYLSNISEQSYDSIFVSTNSGITWQNIGFNNRIMNNVFVINKNMFWGINEKTIYLYEPSSKTWIRRDEGIKALKINDISYSKKGDIYAVNYGVHKSSDNGKTWVYLGLDDQRLNNVLVADNGYLFVAGAHGGLNRGNIFCSFDDGKTWKWINNLYGDNTYLITDLYQNKRGHIYAGIYGVGGYFYSTDYGDSWNNKSTEGVNNCFSTNSEGHIFTGYYAGIVFRSTDDGDTWEQMSEHFTGDNCFWDITRIAFDPKGGNGYALCLKTTDNGMSWKQFNYQDTEPYTPTNFDSLGNYLLPGWRSTNKGQNWEKITTGLEHNRYSHLSVSPEGYYFLGAEYGGLYRSKQRYVSVEDKPLESKIIAYPNPTNNLLFLKLEGESQIFIYNLLGLLVLNELKNYSKSIDVSSLDEGMYIIKIKTGIKIKTEKLIIQR